MNHYMRIQDILNNEQSILIIADIHLTKFEKVKEQRLLQLLDIIIENKVSYLIFLGDIFEFALASAQGFKKQYKMIFNKLQYLSNKNTKIIFIEGNHEFDIKALQQIGLHHIDNYIYKIKVNEHDTFLFTHGDEIFSDIKYKLFKTIVKSKLIITFAKYLFYPALEWFALKQASISRTIQKNKIKNHQKIIFNSFRFLQKHNSDVLFFGHFHEKYSLKNSDNKIIIGVESWEKIPNCVVWTNNNLFRAYYNDSTKDWVVSQDNPLMIR